MNKSKFDIYFINTNLEMETQICKIMGYNKGKFPYKSLGIALEKGLKSNKVWCNTMEKMNSRLGSWQDKWLVKAKKKY